MTTITIQTNNSYADIIYKKLKTDKNLVKVSVRKKKGAKKKLLSNSNSRCLKDIVSLIDTTFTIHQNYQYGLNVTTFCPNTGIEEISERNSAAESARTTRPRPAPGVG